MSSFRSAAIRAAAWANVATLRTASVAPRFVYSQYAARPFSVTASRALAQTQMFREQPKQETETAAAQQTTQEATHDIPRSLWVQNMAFGLTDEEIIEAFSKYGEVTKVYRPEDKKSWAFVIFKDIDSVKVAAENVNGTFWHGRRLRAQPRRGRTPRAREYNGPKTDTLFIGGIPYDSTDADLNQVFSELADLKDVRIATDKSTGWPLGYAHAQFHSVETATKAAEKLSEMQVRGRTLRVTPAMSMKAKRRQRQNHQPVEQQQEREQQQQQEQEQQPKEQ
ncbi:hypothetical protein ACRALDRAFT_1075391 [Sodiomyces alcalophilus JCM 7366]|uniref:uncharacterized protein n=1 Tax=Sodiomyces alcalophilus JCM 7366 TaxID=591952 RepID=UPI0039B4192F